MVAIDPPIRLNGYPDEPIDSTEAAAEFIERHDGPFDVEGTDLIALLRGAETKPQQMRRVRYFDNGPILSDATADSPP
jgi:hypothetical protein